MVAPTVASGTHLHLTPPPLAHALLSLSDTALSSSSVWYSCISKCDTVSIAPHTLSQLARTLIMNYDSCPELASFQTDSEAEIHWQLTWDSLSLSLPQVTESKSFLWELHATKLIPMCQPASFVPSSFLGESWMLQFWWPNSLTSFVEYPGMVL